MKVFIYTLSLMILTFLNVSCGSGVSPDRNIAMARNAIAEGDYDEAIGALDEAKSAMTDTTASASALTETAALYCLVDEKLRTEDYIDKALSCYELAMRINPDSVRYSFSRLSPDEKCLLDLLDKLLTARHDITDFAEPLDDTTADSLQNISSDMEIINDIDIME